MEIDGIGKEEFVRRMANETFVEVIFLKSIAGRCDSELVAIN
jgi:hypothetical protein